MSSTRLGFTTVDFRLIGPPCGPLVGEGRGGRRAAVSIRRTLPDKDLLRGGSNHRPHQIQRLRRLVRRVIQNEVPQRRVIPAKAGIQCPRTRGQVWMPAFAGMTLTFLSHPPILNDSRD